MQRPLHAGRVPVEPSLDVVARGGPDRRLVSCIALRRHEGPPLRTSPPRTEPTSVSSMCQCCLACKAAVPRLPPLLRNTGGPGLARDRGCGLKVGVTALLRQPGGFDGIAPAP